jgi:hypothetical protein
MNVNQEQMTWVDQWTKEAQAAVAGSEWKWLSTHTAPDSSNAQALCEHEGTKERRRVHFSADKFFDEARRLNEIHRQLGISIS